MDAFSEVLSGVGLKGAMFFSRVLGTLAMRPARDPQLPIDESGGAGPCDE